MNEVDIKPTPDDIGKRLDSFLAEKIEGWSRSRLQKLIEDEAILVNTKPAKASYRIHAGDEIDIDLTEAPAARFEPENIPLDIVFENEYLAVINKPAGMVVHPGAGISNGTLANALAFYFGLEVSDHSRSIESEQSQISNLKSQIGSQISNLKSQIGSQISNLRSQIGIVHRLDKDTSGLIVVAKDEQTHEALADQFRDRTVEKSYVALVHGVPRENKGTIDRPLARDRWHRTKMTVAANGRHALSLWKVQQRFDKFTLLDVDIKTGRTHQIRVHLASINHPIVGDATYNEGRDNTINDSDIKRAVESMNRFFLHAQRLAFTHPHTRERISLNCELPPELAQFLKLL